MPCNHYTHGLERKRSIDRLYQSTSSRDLVQTEDENSFDARNEARVFAEMTWTDNATKLNDSIHSHLFISSFFWHKARRTRRLNRLERAAQQGFHGDVFHPVLSCLRCWFSYHDDFSFTNRLAACAVTMVITILRTNLASCLTGRAEQW